MRIWTVKSNCPFPRFFFTSIEVYIYVCFVACFVHFLSLETISELIRFGLIDIAEATKNPTEVGKEKATKSKWFNWKCFVNVFRLIWVLLTVPLLIFTTKFDFYQWPKRRSVLVRAAAVCRCLGLPSARAPARLFWVNWPRVHSSGTAAVSIDVDSVENLLIQRFEHALTVVVIPVHV